MVIEPLDGRDHDGAGREADEALQCLLAGRRVLSHQFGDVARQPAGDIGGHQVMCSLPETGACRRPGIVIGIGKGGLCLQVRHRSVPFRSVPGALHCLGALCRPCRAGPGSGPDSRAREIPRHICNIFAGSPGAGDHRRMGHEIVVQIRCTGKIAIRQGEIIPCC